ncbi:MAG TPA: hypothetical protein VL095_05795 [Flavisolibacter sp.]|nr:hypothetical protein [Flavisolibacter sp.]
MKIYRWFFITLTIAQLVFTVTWFFFLRKFDRVILLSSIIYAGGMFIGYIAFEVEKYRRKRKELIDNLP